MSKLPTHLTYIKRCSYCHKDNYYVMRDTNVNTGISDDDARRMAVRHVGKVEGGYCEHCQKIVELKTVAYDFGAES